MTVERLRRLGLGAVGFIALLMPAAARAGTEPVPSPPARSAAAPDAGAGADTSFVYQLRGTADGIRLSYDREAFLPFSPIVDLKLGASAATIDSTPVTNVHSAIADPGLLGSLGSALPVLGFPPGLVPPWPLSADANYPSGPADAVSGAGTDASIPPDPGLLHGESHAELDHGTGRARAAGAQLSGLFNVAGLASNVDVTRKGTHLIGRAEAKLSGVSLLSGLVRFESLGSQVSIDWPSPAQKAQVTKTLEAAGLTVAGLPIALPKDIQSDLAGTINTALRALAGDRFSVAFAPQTSEFDGGVEVSALRFFVDGKVLPSIPPFLGQEVDRFYVDLGVSGLSYQGESFDQSIPEPSVGGGGVIGPTGQDSSAPLAPVAPGNAEAALDGVSSTGPVATGAGNDVAGGAQLGSSMAAGPAPSPSGGTADRTPAPMVPLAAQGDPVGTIARRIDLLRFMVGPLILIVPGLVLYGRFVLAPSPPVGSSPRLPR